MIRFLSICLILSLFIVKPIWSQSNIFDCANSNKFATYLFNTNQYELAQHELERISFFCDVDSGSQLLLLKSYRKLGAYNKANIFFMGKSFTEIESLNLEYRTEYIKLLMAQQAYQQVQSSIENGLLFKEKNEYEIGTALLLEQWEKAYQLSIQDKTINSFKWNTLTKLAQESFQAKRKKPWISTLMSVVVPGSGKMYCGYWGDGVISFLFTASSAFFSYRAFEKYGSDKIYPWVIGGLAVSYYAGNIYGGNRAAILYNEKLNHEFIHQTENILFTDY